MGISIHKIRHEKGIHSLRDRNIVYDVNVNYIQFGQKMKWIIVNYIHLEFLKKATKVADDALILTITVSCALISHRRRDERTGNLLPKDEFTRFIVSSL